MNELYDPNARLDESGLCHTNPFVKGRRIVTPISKCDLIVVSAYALDEPRETRGGGTNFHNIMVKERGNDISRAIGDGHLQRDWTATLSMGQFGNATFVVQGRTVEEAHDAALLEGRRFAPRENVTVTGVMFGKVKVYA